jgi:signal recognition particle GTPase
VPLTPSGTKKGAKQWCLAIDTWGRLNRKPNLADRLEPIKNTQLTVSSVLKNEKGANR